MENNQIRSELTNKEISRNFENIIEKVVDMYSQFGEDGIIAALETIYSKGTIAIFTDDKISKTEELKSIIREKLIQSNLKHLLNNSSDKKPTQEKKPDEDMTAALEEKLKTLKNELSEENTVDTELMKDINTIYSIFKKEKKDWNEYITNYAHIILRSMKKDSLMGGLQKIIACCSGSTKNAKQEDILISNYSLDNLYVQSKDKTYLIDAGLDYLNSNTAELVKMASSFIDSTDIFVNEKIDKKYSTLVNSPSLNIVKSMCNNKASIELCQKVVIDLANLIEKYYIKLYTEQSKDALAGLNDMISSAVYKDENSVFFKLFNKLNIVCPRINHNLYIDQLNKQISKYKSDIKNCENTISELKNKMAPQPEASSDSTSKSEDSSDDNQELIMKQLLDEIQGYQANIENIENSEFIFSEYKNEVNQEYQNILNDLNKLTPTQIQYVREKICGLLNPIMPIRPKTETFISKIQNYIKQCKSIYKKVSPVIAPILAVILFIVGATYVTLNWSDVYDAASI
ncbi:uncharacterized protein NEPG_00236 [Nematocida parisii ERTm1]|uniref:uncharacterized protein n=1 Tax=Nematocida parisii (strain ERTm1 / ATCC PRA-289) TaxID=881290 RepID=UPI000264BBA1|nr:uncharacterized protein NEPG_00236 [Nematocida parisii ERTm1]EIJ94713.1 hypothetical protein NEPG_00236 [Nematocida parisii ERTm1]|eukprot:XP_013058069.1 hypothetical protein NEPG_00236 [Nematocida parisii ERTm1]